MRELKLSSSSCAAGPSVLAGGRSGALRSGRWRRKRLPGPANAGLQGSGRQGSGRRGGYGRAVRAALLVAVASTLLPALAAAAPQAELWPRWEAHDPESTRVVDHSEWGEIIDRYLVTDTPGGVHLFRYAEVSEEDRRQLQDYLARLESTPVSELNRDEQYAYWFNFYNALTVEVILEHYPVESIREIRLGGLFAQGPWDEPLVTVEGEELTLNDMEHRILRPIWQDPRIHYGVNCASIGCPNLLPEPFTGATVDDQLEAAAAAYINHPRGATVGRRRMTLSSIYDWFQVDFGGDIEGVLAHLREYADEELAEALASPPENVRYEYDWSLNEP